MYKSDLRRSRVASAQVWAWCFFVILTASSIVMALYRWSYIGVSLLSGQYTRRNFGRASGWGINSDTGAAFGIEPLTVSNVFSSVWCTVIE